MISSVQSRDTDRESNDLIEDGPVDVGFQKNGAGGNLGFHAPVRDQPQQHDLLVP
jgi:hypothetical protein